MGEIADALRRAVPLDSPPTKQEHEPEISRDGGLTSCPIAAEPEIDTLPPLETEEHFPERPIGHPVVRLREHGFGPDKLKPARVCLDDPQGHSAQQYRRLAIRLRGMASSRDARSIVVTSAQSGDGKTTTACNLAIALTMTNHNSKVVLVDLDLHRASVAAALDVQIDKPVDAVLSGELTLEQATMETDVEGLFILAANTGASEPEQLLGRHTLAAMLATLANRFDWVILDTPPVLATSDAQVILQHADSALLVVRAGVSPVRAILNAVDHLPKRKILASFLNSSRTKSQQHGYYYDSYQKSPDPAPALSSKPDETEELNVERN
jgi:capsular exopolysaccharide synthesis family protein